MEFSLNTNGYVQLKNKRKLIVLLHVNMDKTLGFTKKLLYQENEIAINKPNLTNVNEIMYVHCNFVHESIINNSQQRQLLSRILITNDDINYYNMVLVTLSDAIYVPVKNITYDKLSFQLCTPWDEPFPVENHTCFHLKLHFKCDQ